MSALLELVPVRSESSGPTGLGIGEFPRKSRNQAKARRTLKRYESARVSIPRSVRACVYEAWTMAAVRKDSPWSGIHLRTFRCKSWRCPMCAPAVNWMDLQRIQTALQSSRRKDLVFLTLTFARDRDVWHAWRNSRRAWPALRERLRYLYGVGKGRGRMLARMRYVGTWEQHRDAEGWPHLHVVIECPELAADVRRRGSFDAKDRGGNPILERDGSPKQKFRWDHQVGRELAVRSGFGRILEISPVRSSEALGDYLAKMAGELTAGGSKDQLPIKAPPGFRRLQASLRWLPKRNRGGGEYMALLRFETLKRAEIRSDRLMEYMAKACDASFVASDDSHPWPEQHPADIAGPNTILEGSTPTKPPAAKGRLKPPLKIRVQAARKSLQSKLEEAHASEVALLMVEWPGA